jgi:hypothetical protein
LYGRKDSGIMPRIAALFLEKLGAGLTQPVSKLRFGSVAPDANRSTEDVIGKQT